MSRTHLRLAQWLLAPLLLALPIEAQNTGVHAVVIYGSEQGLANPTTQALLQDRQGLIWVGTEDGVYRFDGRRFRRFGESEGLKGSVTTLLQEAEGSLWVGTDQGLYRIQANQVQTFGPDRGGPKEPVEALREDGLGRIWVGTRGGCLWGGAEEGFRPIPSFPATGAYSFAVSSQPAAVWVATGDGRLLRGEESQAIPTWSAQYVAQRFQGEPVQAMVVDLQGRLWMRSRRSLWRMTPSGAWEDLGARLSAPAAGRPQLHLDSSGRVWIPTSAGTACVTGEWWSALRLDQGRTAAPARCVIVDREGVPWVGGDDLLRLAGGEAWSGFRVEQGLPSNSVTSLLRDGRGTLWAGTSRGLAKGGPAGFIPSAHTLPTAFLSMVYGADGKVWAAGRPGQQLQSWDPVSGALSSVKVPGLGLPGDTVEALAFDAQGGLWAGVKERGLFRIDHRPGGPVATQEAVPGLGAGSVHALLSDRFGRLWSAGSGGLAVLERGTWRVFGAESGLAGAEPRCLAQARDGSVWVGFRGQLKVQRVGLSSTGLQILENVDAGAGLPAGQAVSLGADPWGGVWIGSTVGLLHWDGRAVDRQGRPDGMPGEECLPGAMWVDTGGELWVGTTAGLGRMEIAYDSEPPNPPSVVFTDIRFGEALLPEWGGGGVEVRGGSRTVEFGFAALSFRNPSRLRYEIRLEGEEDWRPVSVSPVVYPSLSPGRHHLELRARLGQGPWSAPARLELRIAPTWWQSWTFRLLLLLAAGAIVWRAYLWRLATLERRTQELGHQVEARTQDLLTALVDAEAATKAKSEFLATMSHEIRTPMNAILGLTGMLLESPLRPDQRDQAESVRRSAKALLGILNDVLDLSKLEAHKLTLHVGPLDLRELLEETMDLLSVQAQEKGLALLLRYPPSLPRAFQGDSDRIRQVLLNLLGNAIKFTESGHVKVAVSQVPGPHGPEMEVSVSDTGIGITPAQQEKLFEKFSQADSGISRRFGGTGLGLAISRKLVEAMGGRIGVESEEGQGSRFWFSLPLTPGPPIQDHAPGTWSGLRVLLIDPLPESREILAELLAHWRVEYAACATPAEGWEFIAGGRRAHRPWHLVLVDASLDAASALAQPHPDFHEAVVPVLPMNQVQDTAHLREMGLKGILQKPVYPWALADLLDEALMLSEGHDVDWLGAGEEDVTAYRIHDSAPLAVRFRALVVEDNPLNQKVAVHNLEALGGEVVVAGNGREGVALARQGGFDVILMDGQMPGMDGLQAAQAIRRLEQQGQGARIPIVAMTAHALEGDRERFLASGMDAFLVKPFEREELAAALSRVLPGKVALLEGDAKAEPEADLTLDVARLLDNAKDGDSLKELLALFQTYAPPRLAQLRPLLESRQSEGLRASAHALKGSCAYLYARRLARLCGELETAAAAGRWKEASMCVEAVEDEFPKVVAALEEIGASRS
jgi:signal transduction histidine kinase/CheY-like chemotaxis protein/ligand-binding sensor domain-containing protein/HPt (histidine-containing phosphotransfer) domain-containing protein